MADKYAAGAVMGLAVRLTDLGIDRFGVCQAAGCRGVFIDVSTSNTRRYCSDRCMNRANVSAFRARKRGEDEPDAEAPRGHRVALVSGCARGSAGKTLTGYATICEPRAMFVK